MAHWCDSWLHTIVASVILKDNKIMQWKVGQNRLKDKYNIEGLIKAHPEYSFQEKEWDVHNITGHNKVFSKYSKKWFRQWELHEDFVGDSPFEDNLPGITAIKRNNEFL